MKYELTNKTIDSLDGKTLYRIRALMDFGSVKAGDLGGWVESESNLSQEGSCWVFGNAQVFGKARVFGNAQVFGKARVFGNALVSGKAQVFGTAWVSGTAVVYDTAVVSGKAVVYDTAVVSGKAHVSGDTQFTGVVDNKHYVGNALHNGVQIGWVHEKRA